MQQQRKNDDAIWLSYVCKQLQEYIDIASRLLAMAEANHCQLRGIALKKAAAEKFLLHYTEMLLLSAHHSSEPDSPTGKNEKIKKNGKA